MPAQHIPCLLTRCSFILPGRVLESRLPSSAPCRQDVCALRFGEISFFFPTVVPPHPTAQCCQEMLHLWARVPVMSIPFSVFTPMLTLRG